MNWSWLPEFASLILHGLGVTLLIFGVSVMFGFVLALMLALAQIGGNWLVRHAVGWFCLTLRGTPLLLQLFLFYYGLGSLFAASPMLREAAPWLIRLDAIWYVLLVFSLNFAAHESVVLRGGLLAVPRGELEAALSFGFSRIQILRRIWLPAAFTRIYPVLANDVITQLKATPIAFALPVVDVMAAAHHVMQDRLLIYEPLLLIAAIYLLISFLVLRLFAFLGRLGPPRHMA